MIRRAASVAPVFNFLGSMLIAMVLAVVCVRTTAQDARTYVPAAAQTLLPTLREEIVKDWPAVPEPWTLAGQIEQESCISLKHPKCWNPHAELKTSREYGFGLGQTTIAYNADGSVRFNNFEILKAQHKELAGWHWVDRYSAQYQLQAFVLMSRDGFNRVQGSATPRERWAFALAGYNGGAAGVLKERLLCQNTAGCDSSRWWNNVEKTSAKSRLIPPGYGASPFTINRAYPLMVLDVRRDKYRTFWD